MGFYVECARRAFRGSIDGANAAAPIPGAIVLYLLAPLFGMSTAMPDTLYGTVVLGVACLLIAWVIIFVVRFFVEAGRIYAELLTKIDALEGRLTPRIRCSFGDSVPGCVRPNTIVTMHVLRGPHVIPIQLKGTYYRVRVDATGLGSVPCTARIPWIKRNGRDWFDGENLIMPFVPAERPDAETKEVIGGVPEYVDFLFISDAHEVRITTKNFVYPSSINIDEMFKHHGDYQFHFVISSPSSVPVEYDVTLHWAGDAKTARISPD